MPTAEELKAQGNKAFADQEFKKAAKIYRDAIKLDSTNPVLYSNRAQCFIKEQDWNRAIRDCKDGLSLHPNTNTTVKLLYRQGSALKNLGDIPNAKECFNQVLKIDPQNIAVVNELKSIDIIPNKSSILQSQSSVAIPIHDVDSLPEEFQGLINSTIKKPDTSPPLKPTKRLDDEINEMFGGKRSSNTNKKENIIPDPATKTHFSDRPTMQMLSILTTLPENRKVDAYKYITTLTSDYYYDLFGSTGIDSEFLVFFIEAAAYISSRRIIDNWEVKIYDLLSSFSKLRRYELSLLFCSKDHVNEIIDNVITLGDKVVLENYQRLLIY